ncbi:class A sortase [Enterococcus nangangensis]|uniref:class A sortase n=1 Tax=Enterococcus nangangensis TaxID=2559926 RepID=UPI0010F660F1|nr:class A sortase [Enterococcus nangangensis]
MKRKKEKKHRLRNWLVNIAIVLLLLVGLALVFNNQIKDLLISRMSNYDISTLTVEDVKANEEAAAVFDFDQVEAVSTEAVVKAQLASAPKNAVGGIAVPTVGINLAIYKGVSDDNLLYGAATLKPEQKMGEGNYPLASHHMIDKSLLFSPLFNLKMGEPIYLTDLTNIYTYQTDFIETVAPNQTELIEDVPGKSLVTLVTCDNQGTARLIIQGTLTVTTPYKDASADMLDAFGLARNNPGN